MSKDGSGPVKGADGNYYLDGVRVGHDHHPAPSDGYSTSMFGDIPKWVPLDQLQAADITGAALECSTDDATAPLDNRK